MKVMFIILAVLLTSGCGLIKPEVKYVEVPVPISCVSWEPTRPTNTFAVLGADSPLWEQVKALLIDRANDQHFIEGQQSVIDGCKD